ncbi:MAG: CoA transferase [Candidatus Nephthysia bennettiae]|uniref:CoA transferase n=2 Tax=Candidatus Nephthysia bennettiae TaxID=3127016 RepID=A0A934KCM1_9BACT|nr:CoA transferase [Candidatus Dormibacteraeota bacterium]PZR86065.1 MAG: CoA transferase [Candidatus Dormibacteraeota bacterium]
MSEVTHAGPLTGVRVIEVGNFMAGPFCCMQLADLGADVIKVENPAGGDMVRETGPFIDGESANFVRLNRNKRSLALDLKSQAGKEVFNRLVAESDILVENLRPGTMRELALDYQRLSDINPRLIQVSASGWGQDGPYSALAGLDIMAQAMSGLMSITGTEGGELVKVGVPVADLVCALYGALAAVAALRAREMTGRGQLIDVCLLESAVSLSIWEAGKYFTTGEVPRPLGSAHQTSAPYQAVRAADGRFTLGASTPRNWSALCQALALERLEFDVRFVSNALRHSNRAALIALIEEVTLTGPTQHWVSVLQHAGVPCAPIQDFGQVFNDHHLVARDFFPEAPHSLLGPIRQIRSPMRLSETFTRMDWAGPLLGQHTKEVLEELGFDRAQVKSLSDRGVTAVAR